MNDPVDLSAYSLEYLENIRDRTDEERYPAHYSTLQEEIERRRHQVRTGLPAGDHSLSTDPPKPMNDDPDFSRFSLAELEDIRDLTNVQRDPYQYQLLLAEIERRRRIKQPFGVPVQPRPAHLIPTEHPGTSDAYPGIPDFSTYTLADLEYIRDRMERKDDPVYYSKLEQELTTRQQEYAQRMMSAHGLEAAQPGPYPLPPVGPTSAKSSGTKGSGVGAFFLGCSMGCVLGPLLLTALLALGLFLFAPKHLKEIQNPWLLFITIPGGSMLGGLTGAALLLRRKHPVGAGWLALVGGITLAYFQWSLLRSNYKGTVHIPPSIANYERVVLNTPLLWAGLLAVWGLILIVRARRS
jgi:hypothetical protein